MSSGQNTPPWTLKSPQQHSCVKPWDRFPMTMRTKVHNLRNQRWAASLSLLWCWALTLSVANSLRAGAACPGPSSVWQRGALSICELTQPKPSWCLKICECHHSCTLGFQLLLPKTQQMWDCLCPQATSNKVVRSPPAHQYSNWLHFI